MQRNKSDNYENTKDVILVTFNEEGEPEETIVHSMDIAPGDIVKLMGTTQVPMDIVLILTSIHDDGNKCYISTANLDGETNLKLKEGPGQLKDEFPEIIKAGR